MPRYLKAYPIEQLRAFSAWADHATEAGIEEGLVFLDESLVVFADCFEDSGRVFDQVTEEWRTFCRETLGFAVPDWEAESARVQAQLAEET